MYTRVYVSKESHFVFPVTKVSVNAWMKLGGTCSKVKDNCCAVT